MMMWCIRLTVAAAAGNDFCPRAWTSVGRQVVRLVDRGTVPFHCSVHVVCIFLSNLADKAAVLQVAAQADARPVQFVCVPWQQPLTAAQQYSNVAE